MKTLRLLGGIGVAALLAGCGGGGSDGSSGSSEIAVVPSRPDAAPAPSPTPTPVPTSTPTPASAPAPTPTPAPMPASSWAAASVALYDSAPDVANCRTGTLKASVKADVLTRLNAIRALHRLPPVTYSDVDDGQVADASLMMAANGALSHTPPASWKCYTASGAAGAGSGNLYGGTISPYLIWYTEDAYLGGWLTEIASASIGHRRWMLDPFLGKASYGRVSQVLADGSRTDAATLKVFNFTGGTAVPSGLPPFVAYPYGDYPARYFDTGAFLSFSVVANTSSRGGNGGVNFSAAKVSVSDGTTGLAVSDVATDNAGYGLPNNIQWHVAGLRAGVSYTVKITGITGAPASEYSYTFRVVS